MADSRVNRKLAAILSADVVGYSKLMADDEAATVDTIKQYRVAVGHVIERHKGRIVNAPGDNILAEFASAVEAVQAAVEIQKSIEGRNVELPDDRRMHFRVGVNLGDVIEEDDGTIYGDGVNIAARMESLADEGGICISSTIYDAVEGKLDFGFDFLGEQKVKNIAKPVRVYRVRGEARPAMLAPSTDAPPASRRIILAGVVAVVAVIGIGTWWQRGRSNDPPTVTSAQKPTIAVLPFKNLSGDSEQEYFTDGISEDLITLLTQFRDLSVIAPNSMFTYKGKAVDVRTVGREMQAEFVVEGSVRRAGDTVRITAQLLDANDGKHLWAEAFERKLTVRNLFTLQDEISERVATAIAGDYGIINASRIRETLRKPPDRLQSYECVLRVYEYNRLQSQESRDLATECLERVTVAEPDYADAWAWLALVYIEEYAVGNGDRSFIEKGADAVNMAFSVDPSNPIAATMEAYYLYFKRDQRFFDKARKAALANPRDFASLGLLGLAVSWAGKWEEGRVLLDRAIAVSPRPLGWVYLPISHRAFLDGNYRRGLEFALKVDMPGWHWYHVAIAPNYARLGMQREAQAEIALLQESFLDFEHHAYEEFRKWYWVDSDIEPLIQGLREAGMNIPPER